MTAPRVGDIVATTSGKTYIVQHVNGGGRYHLASTTFPHRATWARNVRLHRTWELDGVHRYLDDAERRHAQGYPDHAARAVASAAELLARAVLRGQDTPVDVETTRARFRTVADELAVLDISL